jgi:hypothetical protein
MFDTVSDGHAGHVVVRQDSGLAGGHEICVDEVITPGGVSLELSDAMTRLGSIWVGGPNSWGTSWGDSGRWYMTATEWAWLLAQQGDVTAFVPSTVPAPEPTPVPVDPSVSDPDGDRLWAATKAWAAARHTGSNAKAAAAVKSWARTTGRS